MQIKKVKNICCIGAGYVGGPTMAVIADRCPNIRVEVVDIDKNRIKQWNEKNIKNLPIYEPGLAEIVKRCRGVNLHFSNLVKEKINNADMIFISVNTPTKKKGLGAGKASDLRWVEESARQVAKFAKGHTIVVEKSTLPVRTAEVIQGILTSAELDNDKEEISFNVLSNPEFMAEGTAIQDLEKPDRVLIGGDNLEAMTALLEIYARWVPKEKILFTNIWSSELAKLTANAFLAQRISSINSIAALCEATGADVREVSRAIGTDSRIGSKFLDSGPGFGGSCFKKDILNLVYLAQYFGLNEVANFWESVVNLNNWHQNRISELIVKKLSGTVSGKKIVVLGFAFKANTNDTRESAAIQICKDLIEEGAKILIHDPKVNEMQIEKDLNMKKYERVQNEQEQKLFINKGSWKFSEHLNIFDDAHGVLLLTEWEEYKNIDWIEVSNKMVHPGWVFDARSIIEPGKIRATRLNLWRIGDGTVVTENQS
ncbi:MAG: nucleotide sugar dehydrogenase [Pelagibacteraceae bacterium TMED124]|nr:MAG: nucleotide sugar dehydrogenase [Pelagibacteraceae bacterium TMED124]